MPLRHTPLTLQKASIVVLADNWDLICYSCPTPTSMWKMIESDGYLKTEGPFVNLPSALLEDLMETIGERRALTRKFLHLLIREQLQTLNLSFGSGEVHYGFEFLPRCKKLRSLNLSYLRHIEPNQLLSIIRYLNSIVSLNLQMTCATDKILQAIGDHCPSIRELDLTSTLISDEGIFLLAGERLPTQGDGGSGNEDVPLKRCQRLQRLVVTETRISYVGALCVLRSFPEITDFDFDKIFQVFEHLNPKGLDVAKRGLRLRSLCSTAPCIRPDSIDAAVLCCPKVEILSLMNPWIGNETLYKFMQFEYLRSITILNNDGMTIDFDEGVIPFLQICGPNLENLILNKFKTVNLSSLGVSCPRLRKIAFCNIGEYETNDPTPVTGLFRCLTALELWLDNRTEFTTTDSLHQLLHSCLHITNLLVKKCEGFNLQNLRKIWSSNPMKKLRRLTLDDCRSLTVDVLDQLLEMENELTVLRVWGCAKVTREHSRILKQYISDKNLDVYLEWFDES